MRRPVHHVTVQHVDERLSVSLDVEVDGRLSLAKGHAIASQLERAIAQELGPDVEVELIWSRWPFRICKVTMQVRKRWNVSRPR